MYVKVTNYIWRFVSSSSHTPAFFRTTLISFVWIFLSFCRQPVCVCFLFCLENASDLQGQKAGHKILQQVILTCSPSAVDHFFAELVESSRRALPFYMTLEGYKETSLTKGIVGSLGPGQARCMTSQRQEPTCYRTAKFSSNRHRKLQPFRET